MTGRRRSAIDRRIAPADAAPDRRPRGRTECVHFHDAWGRIVQRFDPAQLEDLPSDLRALLVGAFHEHCADRTPPTRRSTWAALRRFARFIAEDGAIESAGDLDTAALNRYVLWLGRAPGRGRTRPVAPNGAHATAFYLLRPLLLWSQRNRPRVLPADLDIPYNPFPGRRDHQEPRRRLPANQLKAILRACYEEIDDIWARFQHGREIVRQPDLPSKTLRGQGLARWIWRINRIEGGLMPDTATLARHGISSSTLLKFWGGHRTVAQYFHGTTDSLVPFFLAIAVQTAANPEPLRLIRRDCLVPHPLDEHRLIIDWCKPRAGQKLKRAQRRSFDCRRRYAAPNLIEMVLALTEPLVAHAPPGEGEHLFLVRSVHVRHSRRRRDRVAVLEHSVLRRAIGRFIERANRRIDAWNAKHPDNPRNRIESFAPALFRGSVATEHYRASGGDVLVAQAILNHASPVTTQTYIESEAMTRLQRQTIARLQALMVEWVHGSDDIDAQPSGRPQRAAVPFGHDCLAPMLAEANGASRLCPRFGGCLSCPGLVIPIDVEHLARILLARDRFEEARRRLDPQRWELLYAPSWRILTQNILVDFPSDMHEAARSLAATMPALPELE